MDMLTRLAPVADARWRALAGQESVVVQVIQVVPVPFIGVVVRSQPTG